MTGDKSIIFVNKVCKEGDLIILVPHTDWIGDIALTKETFEKMGSPTVGDELLVTITKHVRSSASAREEG